MAPALIPIEQLTSETSLEAHVLEDWIGRRWIRPVEQEGRFFFDETDRARVRLIAELRIDLEVQEDALTIILGLLDQVYALRRTLSDLRGVLEGLPEESREAIERQLRELPKP